MSSLPPFAILLKCCLDVIGLDATQLRTHCDGEYGLGYLEMQLWATVHRMWGGRRVNSKFGSMVRFSMEIAGDEEGTA